MENIIIFGGSITWGAYDKDLGGWVDRLKRDGFQESYMIYNCGISGETTKELKKRILNEILTRGKRYEKELKIVIATGINDSRFFGDERYEETKIEDFKKNLNEILEEIKKLKEFDLESLYFIGLTNVDENFTSPWHKRLWWENSRIKVYSNIIKDFCFENNIKFLDIFNLLEKEDFYDGLHPNSKGHEKMKNKIKKFIIKNL